MGRNVVITGGTGFLGSAVVSHFLAAGDTVIVTDLREDFSGFVGRLGNPDELYTYTLNGTDPDALGTFASELRDRFGGIQVLVNIVGGFHWAPFAETTPADLNHMLNLNVHTTFLTCQALLPLLQAAPYGRIVNVGARTGLTGGAGVTAYGLAKAAVINFTQSLSQELIASDVTVNAVLPSIIDTPPNRSSMPDATFSDWVAPADLAAVITFLASESARAVRGAAIPVYNRA